jgi:PAS domain S-box-containing protein
VKWGPPAELISLIEALPYAVLVLAREGRVLQANRRAAELFGCDAGDLAGLEVKEILPDALEALRHSSGSLTTTARRSDAEEFSTELAFASWTMPDAEFTRVVLLREGARQDNGVQQRLRQLSQAVEQSPESVVIADVNGGIEYVNPAFSRLTGYSSEEVRGQNPRILKTGHTSAAEYERLWKTISSGGIWRGEFLNKKKNGELYWESASISPVLDETGRITNYVAVKEDITARKRAEQELRASEERFRNVFQHAGIGIAIADIEGRFVQCNPGFGEITGYSVEELSRMNFTSLLHPDDREESLRLQSLLRKKVIPFFGLESRYIHKNGDPVWVRKFITLLHNDRGEQTHLLALVTDVTNHMRKNAALRRQAELLHLSHDAVFTWDTKTGITFWNKGATDLYGYHADEVRGRVASELLKTGYPCPWRQIERELLKNGYWEGQVRHVTKAGAHLVVDSRLQLVPGDSGDGPLILETNRDVTDRRRLEREIIEISERERRKFGQELHDDLGQQLTSVMMMAGLLADELRKHSPDRTADAEELVLLLKRAMQSARRMARGLYPTELEGGSLVQALEGLANAVTSTSGVQCRLRLDTGFQAATPDAGIHIYRIVQEALNNAIKHGHASEITVECRVSDGQITLTVTNDGRPADLPPFAGEGMGLSLMRHRAHLLEGEVEIQPLETGGCRVVCSIPVKPH